MNPDKIKYNFSWTQEYKDGLTKKLNDAIGGLGPQDWEEKDVADDKFIEANEVINRIRAMK